ncbi:hypothetical protein EJF36_07820 [Bacillus sp. HMF5848]|uniref:hypothetical protein n=1 Tax=Bacillus sp. HMF5848 TaxID=2495421 RepID=UPI000F78544C|nr:hypothetical protein [Bacillus sp. HMF5848]RSK26776.1 hypothetical protein EJF36_07820 [Bacillus sp. HMF5848]
MRIVAFVVWLSFVLYSTFLSPGLSIERDPVFLKLMQIQADEPLVLLMFMYLGIWPVTLVLLLLHEDRNAVPAWPFVIASFFLGAFSILPYLFLRNEKQQIKNRTPAWVLRGVLSTRVVAVLLVIVVSTTVFYSLNGSISAYIEVFMNSQFVHIMTIDFFVLSFTSGYIIYQQTGRKSWGILSCLLPLLGALLYIYTRNRLE